MAVGSQLRLHRLDLGSDLADVSAQGGGTGRARRVHDLANLIVRGGVIGVADNNGGGVVQQTELSDGIRGLRQASLELDNLH